MNDTRRKFIGLTALSLGAACRKANADTGEDELDLSSLARFVDPLPIPPQAVPSGLIASRENPAHKIPRYRISMRQFQAKVHRDVTATTMWGYNGASPGPTIEARSGAPIRVEWINSLPSRHLFPVDHTLDGASSDKPEVRTVVHLHGGRTGPESDGYPETWITPGHSTTAYYPNQQDSAALFYHDHAMGITHA